jgi:hypothetical protein
MASAVPRILDANSAHMKASVQEQIQNSVDDLICSLPDIDELTTEQRRGIIGRYTAVLEGNFIYWMTAALLAVKSEKARSIILENLAEEVRDCHPGMLRRFALAADAMPTQADALAVSRPLTAVRLFVGRLSAVQIVVMMAFFEGFIQRFMSYLSSLSERQGSLEQEYTDVHGICDVAHTAELFHALDAEMALRREKETGLYEGIDLLRELIETIVGKPDAEFSAAARETAHEA